MLRPELVYARLGTSADLQALGSHHPSRERYVYSGLLLVLVCALSALIDGTLKSDLKWGMDLVFTTHPPASEFSLNFLRDPIGLAILAVAFATPVILADQIRSIRDHIPMSFRNGAAEFADRPGGYQTYEMYLVIAKANRWFAFVGAPITTIAILASSLFTSIATVRLFKTEGLFDSRLVHSINGNGSLPWAGSLYKAWWANDQHALGHAALVVALAYAIFYLYKQLLLGAIFMLYSLDAWRTGFFVTPSFLINIDGYNGLRSLRRFMIVTWLSALMHQTLYHYLYAVLLPFQWWSLAAFVSVYILPLAVVVAPTAIASACVAASKERWLRWLFDRSSVTQLSELADTVWSSGTLPFRVRGILSAVSIYLLFPATIVFINTALG